MAHIVPKHFPEKVPKVHIKFKSCVYQKETVETKPGGQFDTMGIWHII